MSCDEIRAILSDALDGGEITEEIETAAAAHLETCSLCARSARELSSIHRLILEDQAGGLATARKRPSRRLLLASLAACLVVGLAAFVLFTGSRASATLERLSGRVLLNGRPAQAGDPVRDGDSLRSEGPLAHAIVT